MMEEFILVPLSLWQSKLDGTKSQMPQQLQKRENIPPTLSTTKEKEDIAIQDRNIKSDLVGDNKKKHEILKKIRDNSNVEISTDETIILDTQDTGIYVAGFINDLFRAKTVIPDIYLTILDRLGLDRSLVTNEHALTTSRGSWITLRK